MKVIINEQHVLLKEQHDQILNIFGNNWTYMVVPSDGWSIDDINNIVGELRDEDAVVFVSPVPLLLRDLSFERGFAQASEYPQIWLFVKENRQSDTWVLV